MKTLCGATLMLGLFLFGCGVTPTEGDRNLNHQNKEAGQFIAASAEAPEIKRAGADVAANSETLERNLIGAPEKPVPYDAAASEAARGQSTQEHQRKWYESVWSAVAAFLLGGGAFRIGLSVAPRIFGGPIGAALSAVIEGVAAVRSRATASSDQKVQAGDIVPLLVMAQQNAGVQALVSAWVKRIEEKLSKKAKPQGTA